MTILSRTRALLFDHFGLKVLALFIAFAMWWGVAHDPVIEVPINVPIEFHNVPDSLEISSEVIPTVQIRVSGPTRVVRDLAQTDIHPVLDLRNAAPGERTYNLTPRLITVPTDVKIVQIVPSQFRVSFDSRETKTVDVRPRVIGTFASGYRISSTETDPATLTIVGPARRLRSIDNAITDPVDATGVIGRATFTTQAYIADPLVHVRDPQPIRVTVITEKASARNSAP